MSEYSHLQFSGVIPTAIAKEAFALLKRGMDGRPKDCGGVLSIDPRTGKGDPAAFDRSEVVFLNPTEIES